MITDGLGVWFLVSGSWCLVSGAARLQCPNESGQKTTHSSAQRQNSVSFGILDIRSACSDQNLRFKLHQ